MPTLNTLEITIQRSAGHTWPIVAEQTVPGGLPVRREGELTLPATFQEDLLTLQLDPLAYGALLGQALFRDQIRDLLMQARRDSDTVRLLMVIEDLNLRQLHWQRLCAPTSSGEWQLLATDQRVVLSQYLPSLTDRRFPAIGRRDLRSLVVIANPPPNNHYGLATFDADATITSVQQALGDIPFALLAMPTALAGVTPVGKPTLGDLAEQLTSQPYTLLHIVAHGKYQPNQGETILYLLDQAGEVKPVTASDFRRRLEQVQGQRGLPQLAFLCTCESAAPAAEAHPAARANNESALGGLAQQLVRQLGLPAVVAMTEKVSIATAGALAAAFYRQLRQHGEPDRALAQATAGMADQPDISVPALFSRLGARPLFSDLLTDRPLTNQEIEFGLTQFGAHLPTRAPILAGRFEELSSRLRATLTAEEAALSREMHSERQQALDEIDALSLETLDLSFPALALGQTPPTYDQRCPFLGLAAFQLADQAFFFGREKLVQTLEKRVMEHPFLAILGPSGSGKSSLVLAGLLPVLQQKSPGLKLLYMTPTQEPVRQLERLLAGETLDQTEMILVVDQFEEIFTLCTDPAKRQRFVDHLLALVSRPSSVVLTMRADFWGECAAYPALRVKMQAHQELIAPMNLAELRSALEQQAGVVGLRLEAELAQTILDDVQGEPGAMPLLQHTLLELWKRRHGRWLRSAEYRKLGGVQQAIAHSADAIYNDPTLDQADRERIRTIFLRLTRLDEEAMTEAEQRDTRRRVRFMEIAPVGESLAPLRTLVTRLADARLLVTSLDSGGDQANFQVEVAHEALIRYWPRLRDWLNSDRQFLLWRQRLRTAVSEWLRTDLDEGALLRGLNLSEAERWVGEHAKDLSKEELDFCATSKALHERDLAEERQRQQERAEAAEQVAAEQRQRAEAEARRARTFRWAAIISSLLLVVAIAATYWALDRQAVAETRAVEAQDERDKAVAAQNRTLATDARRLANLAMQQLTIDPSISLGLSLYALAAPRPYAPEAEYSLAQALRSVQGRQQVTTTVVLPAQVAIGPEWIAVGGSELRLLDRQLQVRAALRQPDACTDLDHAQDCLIGVAWGPNHALLAYDHANLFVWQGTELVAQQSFAKLGPVRCAAWHPQENRIAVCTGSGISIWAPGSGNPTPLSVDLGEADRANLAWSPNGRWLAGWSAHLVVWDGSTERSVLQQVGEPGAYVGGASWSADGQHLAAYWSQVAQVGLWSLDASQPTVQWLPLQNAVRGLAFSEKGLFVWSAAGELGQWTEAGASIRSYYTAQQINSLSGGGVAAPLAGVALAPSGDNVLVYDDHAHAELLSLADGAQPVRTLTGHQSRINTAAWRADGKYLATGTINGELMVWDAQQGEQVSILVGESERLLGLHWLDDRRLFSYSQAYSQPNRPGALRIWQVFDEAGQPYCPASAQDKTTPCRFFSRRWAGASVTQGLKELRWINNDLAIALAFDGALYRWNLNNGQVISLTGEAGRNLTVAPAGNQLFTYGPQESGQIWQVDGPGWRPVATVGGPLSYAIWLPSGLLLGHTDGAVELVHPITGEQTPLSPAAGINHAIQLDADQIVWADNLGALHLWDVVTRQQVAEVATAGGLVLALDATADGQQVAVLYSTGQVQLWQVQQPSNVQALVLPTAGFDPKSLEVAVDAPFLAVVMDGVLFVVDVEKGEIYAYTGSGDLRGATWLPSGERLLAWDNTAVYLLRWDAAAQRVYPLMAVAHTNAADPRIRPDGRAILASAEDETLRLWTVWPDVNALIDAAHTCCHAPIFTPLQRLNFGIEEPLTE
jgi:WD40 repeat protein/energy-coupling factor transporter ATP-binding protein EcfA2